MNLLKRLTQPWCPICKAPAGPDCPDKSIRRRAANKKIRRGWKARRFDRA